MQPINRETAQTAVAHLQDAVAVATPETWEFTPTAAEALGEWLDSQLDALEDRFAAFRTRDSVRNALRGDRQRD
ncbi:MAG: hypothetical protein RIC55_18265 [Pirellulaceae bacterium]